jgi:dCTP deaminase
VGVLSNRALAAAIGAGRIRITSAPLPLSHGEAGAYGTCSLDLQLSPEIFVPRPGLQINLSIRGQIGSTLNAIYERHEIPAGGWILYPNRFILGRTIERVALPLSRESLAARIEGRSSYARTGLLVHFTAPTIHAGFDGTITLEMINLGEYPLVLLPNSAICQLIVETVEGEPLRSDSQFQGQSSATGAL